MRKKIFKTSLIGSTYLYPFQTFVRAKQRKDNVFCLFGALGAWRVCIQFQNHFEGFPWEFPMTIFFASVLILKFRHKPLSTVLKASHGRLSELIKLLKPFLH